MTSKGQVTIPLTLRERYGLTAGAEVEVIASADGALVRSVQRSAGRRDLLAGMRDQADGGMHADSVLSLTRGDEPV